MRRLAVENIDHSRAKTSPQRRAAPYGRPLKSPKGCPVAGAPLWSLRQSHMKGRLAPLYPAPPMKWAHHPNLRKRLRTPAKGRGSDNGILSPTASAGTGGVSSWTRVRSGTGRRVLARLRAAFAERASRGIGLESSVTRRYDVETSSANFF